MMMNDDERRGYQEELRRNRHARALLDAMGIERSATTLTEMAETERLVDATTAAVARIERVGFAQGWSEATVFWQDWIWPDSDPAIVDEALGLPGSR